jgi:hypothetical protein
MFISACSMVPTPKLTATPYEEFANVPEITLPANINGLIIVLQGQDIEARIQAARVVGGMGPGAEAAVPALTQNLNHPYFEVRRAAVEALGNIGPAAKSSIPVLIVTLLTDSYVHARVSAAISLGEIGETICIPALATSLEDESDSVQVRSAIVIGLLTGQEFPDLNGPGYSLNEDGIPLIVIAARKWWENDGRYQDWTGE